MADENATDPSDANQKIMQDMINKAKGITPDEIPENAVRWIVETLQNSTALKNFHINNACLTSVGLFKLIICTEFQSKSKGSLWL